MPAAAPFEMSRESSDTQLKHTALHDRHLAAGARMVDFGGWSMPLQYTGIADEHLAVRTRAGLFDVSHMGEIELAGRDALAALQHMVTNDASRLEPGQIQYSLLTTPEGTLVDDVLVYRWAEEHYLLVVNAANTRKDAQWISARASEFGGDVAVVNTSSRYALIALQGPAAADVLGELASVDLTEIKYYRFATGEVAGARAVISRTGYTGEDGFEIFVPPAQAPAVWDAIVAAGRSVDLRLCGLGARDTLRLEACMRLYGNEMDETVTALEAGLERYVAWSKPEFIGHESLRRERDAGSARRIVAFEMVDRAIARPGQPVMDGETACGRVTSGTQTPHLQKAIGLALVPSAMAEIGRELAIDVRGRRSAARVVPEPFYRRPKKSTTAAASE
jgi:aminomethyltransferase